MVGLKNQVENLNLLVFSVESKMVARDENRMVARTTEAWLLTLCKDLAEVEQDSEEAFESRREVAKLLVERIVADRDEEDRTKVDLTYRFGPPEVAVGEDSAHGVQNSEEFARAHGRGSAGELRREHPRMTSYEIAVERGGPGAG